MTIFTCG